MNTYLKFKVLPNGNLKISITKEGRKYLREELLKRKDPSEKHSKDYESIWSDLLEVYHANGSYSLVDPEWIAALTDAPIIAEDVTFEDDGKVNVIGNVWWFPEYMVVDEFAEIRKKGSIIFTKAENS